MGFIMYFHTRVSLALYFAHTRYHVLLTPSILFLRESPDAAWADLELLVFLFQPPECWDCRCSPLYPVLVELLLGARQ